MSFFCHYKKVKLDIFIPAFDLKKQGLIIPLKLSAAPSTKFGIEITGSIAKSLEKGFTRVVHIMSSLKYSWHCLENFHYSLESFDENYRVKDARSADLALCIAALNIVRNHNQMSFINTYIGTGSLRVDGSINETFLEDIKQRAILTDDNVQKKFITSKNCNHIFDLEDLLSVC